MLGEPPRQKFIYYFVALHIAQKSEYQINP